MTEAGGSTRVNEILRDIELTNENVQVRARELGWHGAGSVADAWCFLRRIRVIPKDDFGK